MKPIDTRDAKKISREKIVYLCTGSQGEPMGAMMRIASHVHPDVIIEKEDSVKGFHSKSQVDSYL